MKVLFVSNTSWYLYNFRLALARALRDLGAEVVFVAPEDAYSGRIEQAGFRWIDWPLKRRSLNPARELLALAGLWQIYRSEKPGFVHHFTIKCVLYGSLAAFASGVTGIVNSLTGLGFVFVNRGLTARLLRPLAVFVYRRVLRAPSVRVVFQNPDDLEAFGAMGLTDRARTALIRGSGVDCEKLRPQAAAPGEPIVLFASRLTFDKGVREYHAAAAALKARGVKARFQLAGAADPGNPTAIGASELERWKKDGALEVLGHVDGIERVLAPAAVVVLPSYREGVPRILLEAAAMAKPLVTTDAPGCREAVEDGKNGFLVPVGDAGALASAIEKLLSDPALRARFGASGRQKVLAEFDDKRVIAMTLDVYRSLEGGAGKF